MTFEAFARSVDPDASIAQSGNTVRFSNRTGGVFSLEIADLERGLTHFHAKHDEIKAFVESHAECNSALGPWGWKEQVYRDVFLTFFSDAQFAALTSSVRSQSRPTVTLLSKYVGWRTGNVRCGPRDLLLFDKASLTSFVNAPRTTLAEAADIVAAPATESLEFAFANVCRATKLYNDTSGPWLSNSPEAAEVAAKLGIITTWLEKALPEARGFRFKHATGSGKFPKIPWIALLPPGQEVSNGAYVAICFGLEGAGAVVGFASSVDTDTGLVTVDRPHTSRRIDVKQYNNAYVNPRELLVEGFQAAWLLNHARDSVLKALAYLTPTSEHSFGAEDAKECGKAIAETGLLYRPELVKHALLALASKPFLILTGASGTGKTRLAESLAIWLSAGEDKRVAVVPVGADWTDSRNVLGFVNFLRNSTDSVSGKVRPVFQSTRTLDLLIDASKDPGNPYFLILDEMNLSHVERYFADFLSTMESASARLHLHSESDSLPRSVDGPLDVPQQLTLPRNVFVMGTVNVDETTYTFSPKVLDRAFVLEFRAEAETIQEFLRWPSTAPAAAVVCPPEVAASFLQFAREIRGGLGRHKLGWETVASADPTASDPAVAACGRTISELFNLLSAIRRPFAFRSVREMQIFLTADYAFSSDRGSWEWRDALDVAVLMKVLPRIHGSRRAIAPLLTALIKYCENQSLDDALAIVRAGVEVQSPSATSTTQPMLPRCHAKLTEMLEDLRRDQFVSFLG